MSEPVLTVDEPAGPVRALALVLHGGRARSRRPVRGHHLAVLRMRPFATALARAGAADGLAVARLRYVVRGWNDELQSPVADARWALAELAGRYPGTPVALVGHSMGGRTAVYVAGEANVRAVVGLAPWIEPGDPVTQLSGRRLFIAHGDRDRMTSPRASASFARAAEEYAESVSYVTVRDERHAMLRRSHVWHRLTAGYVVGVLLGTSPHRTGDDRTTNVLAQVLAGHRKLVV